MSKVLAGATTSLDGYVQDVDGSSMALYIDFETLGDSDYMAALVAETGAVIMGRRSFEGAEDPDGYAEAYEFQVPIFVITSSPPEHHPRENDRLRFTFVTDGLVSAVDQAKAAAGDRDVTVVGGATTIKGLLREGLVDVLCIDVMPVLLGGGTRLLDDLPQPPPGLELVQCERVGQRTVLRFAVSAG